MLAVGLAVVAIRPGRPPSTCPSTGTTELALVPKEPADRLTASVPARDPRRMDWVLVTVGIAGAIVVAALVANRRGSPVEMPGGETIFDAPPQFERPSPHRTLDE